MTRSVEDVIRSRACPVHYIPPDDAHGEGGKLVNEDGDTEARGFLDIEGARHWADYYGYPVVTGTGAV